MVLPTQVTNIRLITTGIVRNLLKTPYHLRIPADPYRKDRIGKKIVIPATEDVEIDYRDWKLVEFDLITKDRLNILRIIRYPAAAPCNAVMIVIHSYADLPPAPPPPGTIVWAQYGDYQGIYYYDETRNAWLSENEIVQTWNSDTNVNSHVVNLVNNSDGTHKDNDVECTIPMTITGMAASQANSLAAGNSTRFTINAFNLTTGLVTDNVANIDLTVVGDRGVSSTATNFPIDDGNVISASRVKLSGTDTVTRPALTIWYRWRLTP